MQTFLPHPSFEQSLACLDFRRLNKQRLEALQIYKIITGISPNSRWRNHPAVRMWRGSSESLALYYNLCIEEWVQRGYVNNMIKIEIPHRIKYPIWFGRYDFHASHRSNLLRKNPEFYSRYGWIEPDTLPYIWP